MMEKWKKIYNFICDFCGVDGITLENFPYVKEKASEILLNLPKIAYENSFSESDLREVVNLIAKPTYSQAQALRAIYDLSKDGRSISLKDVKDYLNRRTIGIKKGVLEEMGIIRRGNSRKSLIEVNHEIFEKYYPEILSLNIENSYKVEKKRVKSNERMKQALEVLGVSSIKKLGKEYLSKIEELSVTDFHKKGFLDVNGRKVRYIQKKLIEKIKENEMVGIQKMILLK